MGCIYKLTFKSGKSYIGQTVRSLNTRITAHKATMTAGSMLAVYCAWRVHGEPEIQVLARSDDAEELHRLEREAIEAHGTISPGGYNITEGGDTAPSKAPEVAAKIAAKATGRKWSEEKKAQMAAAMRKRWEDPEYRSLVTAKAREGHTEESRARRSASAKAAWQKKLSAGWSMPEATKEKMRAKVVSEETRAKMSAAAIGKRKAHRSDETRAKLAAAAQAFWANPECKAKRAEQIRSGQAAAHEVMSSSAKARWANPEYRANRAALNASRKANKET